MSQTDTAMSSSINPISLMQGKLELLEVWIEKTKQEGGEAEVLQDLRWKQEEYLGLLEELEILAKKLRKTHKLLEDPNQNQTQKLEKKKEQYHRETNDIVQYLVSDPYFAEDSDNGEQALDTDGSGTYGMSSNSLLGKPLSTLIEMPGMEGSSRNFRDGELPSLDDDADQEETGFQGGEDLGNPDGAHGEQREALDEELLQKKGTEETHDTSASHSPSLLKKKIQKAEKMLKAATTEKQRNKLRGKIAEYQSTLHELKNETTGKKTATTRNGKYLGNGKQDPKESVRTPAPAPAMSDEGLQEYTLLKKKLSKAGKLQENAKNMKEKKKFSRKIQEYFRNLDEFDRWQDDRSSFLGLEDAAASILREESSSNAAEPKVKGVASSAQPPPSLTQTMPSSSPGKQAPSSDRSNQLVHKKLGKLEEMLQEVIDQYGLEKAQTTKKYGKLLKKRQQYLDELGEPAREYCDRNGGDSPTMVAPRQTQKEHNGDSIPNDSLVLQSLGGSEGDDESFELQREEVLQEQTQQNMKQSRNEAAKRAERVKKKLRKVEGMIQDILDDGGTAVLDSHEFQKLDRKRLQYLEELGVEEGSEEWEELKECSDDENDDNYSRDTISVSINSSEEISLEDEVSGRRNEVLENGHNSSTSIHQDSAQSELDLQQEGLRNQKHVAKKLKKLEGMIQDMIDQHGEDIQSTKDFRKLLKKRRQYLIELGEDEVSIENSFGDISMGELSKDSSFASVLSESRSSVSQADVEQEESQVTRQPPLAGEREREREARAHQISRVRDQTAGGKKKAGKGKKVSKERVAEIRLYKKKLAKLDNMIAEADQNGKSTAKLLKKREEYLAHL